MGTPNAMEQCLDRAFATRTWLTMFPNVQLLNLIFPKLGHSPLVLVCSPLKEERCGRGFKFENVWLTESDLPHVVQEGWYKVGDQDVLSKLRSCASVLTPWGRSIKMKFQDDISAFVVRRWRKPDIDETIEVLNSITSSPGS